MKKLVLGAAIIVAFVGCRALVGIDDLDVQQNNSGPNNNQQSGNARKDQCVAGDPQQCVPCCKRDEKSYKDTFENGPVACLCGTPDAPCPDCATVSCVDSVLKSPDNKCGPACPDRDCQDVLDCLKACK